MNHRAFGFAALLGVIGLSIVFGMILGGRLNAPHLMLAAPGSAGGLHLAPMTTATPAVPNFADVVEASLPAVVSITSTQVRQVQQNRARPRTPEEFFRFWFPEQPEEDPRRMPMIEGGSGFIISPDGYILTNNHVIEDADSVKVRLSTGKEYKGEVVGTDPSIDLALLKIEAKGLPILPLGNSGDVRVGEWVIAIGNPHEFDQTVTVGVISGKERRVPIGTTDRSLVSFIQTDAAINFGNSGGPLIDARGNVIGISTAIRRADYAEGIGFALPISQASEVVDQLRESGHVERGFIGISMSDHGIDENAREYYGLPDTNGVIVEQVRPADGPAAKAGVKPGDIIRKVDGDVIKDNLDLVSKIASRHPGDSVRLEVFRAGKTLRLEATLADRREEMQAAGGEEQRRQPGQRDAKPEASTRLGLTVENLDSRMRESMGLGEDQAGVLVKEVDFESEAAEKGIQPEIMLITAVNDQQVRNVAEWNRTHDRLRPGAVVKLDILLAQAGEGERTIFIYLKMPPAAE